VQRAKAGSIPLRSTKFEGNFMRFYVPPDSIFPDKNLIEIKDKSEVHHIRDVMRLKKGEGPAPAGFKLGVRGKGQEVAFLGQGTLYPDVIESVSFKGPSATIKSHHNVGGLPEKMNVQLIEPFRELFKDEVRELGRELGIGDDLLLRQPFPGPGLAVRIIGPVNEENLKLLREADAIIIEEFKNFNLYHEVWQSFAVLLPVKTVGVMGDERTYEKVIVLRAVESRDGMTADWVKLPYEILDKISNRIINEVRGVNRVVYDISSKPPSTIEWE